MALNKSFARQLPSGCFFDDLGVNSSCFFRSAMNPGSQSSINAHTVETHAGAASLFHSMHSAHHADRVEKKTLSWKHCSLIDDVKKHECLQKKQVSSVSIIRPSAER